MTFLDGFWLAAGATGWLALAAVVVGIVLIGGGVAYEAHLRAKSRRRQ